MLLSGRAATLHVRRSVSSATVRASWNGTLLQLSTKRLHHLSPHLTRPAHLSRTVVSHPRRLLLAVSSPAVPSRALRSARHALSQPDTATTPLRQASTAHTSVPAMSSSGRSVGELWRWWTSEPPPHRRYSALWWRDAVLVLVVFSVTGSLSLLVVKPLLSSVLGVSGSLRDGPNSYRLLSVLLVPPAYSVMLLTIGTLVGQHHYFRKVAMRMWGRLLPKSWTGGSKRTADKLK